MKYVITLICLVLGGCGEDSSMQPREPRIDPVLAEYMEMFKADAAEHGVEIDTSSLNTLMFWPLEKPLLGRCVIGDNANVYIRTGLSGNVLKWTVYHELGHCVLLQNHDDSKGHIMNTYYTGYDEDNWDLMVETLFKE